MMKAKIDLIKAKNCLINFVFTFFSTVGLNFLLSFVIGPFVIMPIIYKLLYAIGLISKFYYLHSNQAKVDKMVYGGELGIIFFMILYYVVIKVKSKGDKSKIISSFNLNKLTWKQIGFYIVFGLISSGMFYSINRFLGTVFIETEKSRTYAINSMKNSFSFVVFLLGATTIGPIYEELLFRNLVPRKLKKSFSPFWIIIIQGLFFGVAHLNIIKFFSTSFLGILTFIIVLWSGSLYAGIIIHLTNNNQIFIQSFIKKILMKIFNYSDIAISQFLDKSYILTSVLLIPMLWIAYKNRKYNALDEEHPYYD